jgi:hypothetical protein
MMTITNTTEEPYVYADSYGQNLISDTEYAMLQRGFLPPYVRNWVVNSLGAVPSRLRRELQAICNEEKYDPRAAIAIVFCCIERQKSIRKWVSNNLRKSYQSIDPAVKVGGKWVDAMFTQFPPFKGGLTKNNTFKHVPARYVFKHGDIRVDLGTQEGKFSPVLHDNPTSAMQAVATRLGRRINGDWTHIVKALCNNDDLVGTTVTAKIGNQWVVLITPMRDAKITPSRFAVTEAGEVITGDVHNQAASISEVEYSLIKGLIREEDDEMAVDYGFEFDESHQAQFMMEYNGEKMDESTMTPTELIMMDLAAENGELIDFMTNGAVKDEWVDLIHERVKQRSKELYQKYMVGAKGHVNEAEIARISEMEAHWQHAYMFDALEECLAYTEYPNVEKSYFNVRGSKMNRKRFFGVPSAYEIKNQYRLPARNPVRQDTFLPVSDYVAPQDNIKVVNDIPECLVAAPVVEKHRGQYGTVCVNASGHRAVAPTKEPKKLNASNMSPRLASIVWALELTGSLKKAQHVAKKKLRFS